MRQGLLDYVTALGALFATLITTLGFALSTYILADGGMLLDQLEKGDTAPLDTAAPIAAGIGAIFVAHELAHFVAAKKHGVRIGVPIVLPSLQLGLFGCITRLTSFAPSRQALFEFAFAGPAVGFTLSLLIYSFGLGLSADLELPPNVAENIAAAAAAVADPANAPAAAPVKAAASGVTSLSELTPVIPSSLLTSSFLLGGLAILALPTLTTSPAIALHPLAVVGFVGALVNALQFLPVGRLDGGRVAFAVLGQGLAGLVSGVFLLLLGLSTIFGGDNPILLFFGLVIIFLQRSQELPSLDDITGVTPASQVAAAVALLLATLTLLPYPATPLPVNAPPFF